ncbi:MAG: NADH-quinone oxidoreductase subunit C [Verrucomicrobiota bacterium]
MKPSLEEVHAGLLALLQEMSPGADLALANAPATPDAPLLTEFKAKGVHLDVRLTPGQLTTAARFLDEQGFAFDTVTGVDWLAADQMELIYDFFHPEAPWQIVLRTRVPRQHPEVPTLSAIFPGANWHERETHEFLGILFTGHPNLIPLLLPEDATYHPLRKDFSGAS